MAHNYILQVTAGSEYDITKHKIVSVNHAKPTTIHSESISVDLNVRIQVGSISPLRRAQLTVPVISWTASVFF
jgi:hypothetical protein